MPASSLDAVVLRGGAARSIHLARIAGEVDQAERGQVGGMIDLLREEYASSLPSPSKWRERRDVRCKRFSHRPSVQLALQWRIVARIDRLLQEILFLSRVQNWLTL